MSREIHNINPLEMNTSKPDYIRSGSTVFEHDGVKYGYVFSGKDLYVDGPESDEFDSCYIVRPDGIVDGNNGAVPESEQPQWVHAAMEIVSKSGEWGRKIDEYRESISESEEEL